MNVHHSINYIEFPSTDFEATKKFYSSVFGWEFTDWGPEYISFSKAEVEGGFAKVDTTPPRGGSLVILYSDDLEATMKAVQDGGAEISLDIIHFPGGRRFQFLDPTGNELAVWTIVNDEATS